MGPIKYLQDDVYLFANLETIFITSNIDISLPHSSNKDILWHVMYYASCHHFTVIRCMKLLA